ncbi:hypothetical protein [Amycolatopsis sp. NPDC003861]
MVESEADAGLLGRAAAMFAVTNVGDLVLLAVLSARRPAAVVWSRSWRGSSWASRRSWPGAL